MDITDHQELDWSSGALAMRQAVMYPREIAYHDNVTALFRNLSQSNLKENLEGLTSFHTRYYKSHWGAESATWLLGKVNRTLEDARAIEHGADVRRFEHPWGQPSLIATIPGKSNRTIVIGAHQDSINLFFPSLLAAPGADDDGSGTVTILEALRVLLQSDGILRGQAENTVEFHWYSAEEGGLLGSQAVFADYKKHRRDVIAMIQTDMTGFTRKTIQAGEVESVGVITDYVDAGLTEFIKKIITAVSHLSCLPFLNAFPS